MLFRRSNKKNKENKEHFTSSSSEKTSMILWKVGLVCISLAVIIWFIYKYVFHNKKNNKSTNQPNYQTHNKQVIPREVYENTNNNNPMHGMS